MKLTPAQNKVINCLQNGFSISTDSEVCGAVIGTSDFEFNIGNRLFWNLVDKGLIMQDTAHRVGGTWGYILTELGENIKTKDILNSL